MTGLGQAVSATLLLALLWRIRIIEQKLHVIDYSVGR